MPSTPCAAWPFTSRPEVSVQSHRICGVVRLGLIEYRRAWELQRQLVRARQAGAVPDLLLLCEHPHVITLGRNARREHIRASRHLLAQMGVDVVETDRGGDVTYHGPGQLVGYPILYVAALRRDVVWYVRQLEETLIQATAAFGLSARREPRRTGVWVDTPAGPAKLAAIGIHFSRWVSSHGFAYNVATDLRYFDLIVPCGIADRPVTSLERLLGRTPAPASVADAVAACFADVFGYALKPVTPETLDHWLAEAPAAAGGGS